MATKPTYEELKQKIKELEKEALECKRMEMYIGKLNRLQELLLGPDNLSIKLKYITDWLVKTFDADFARIWIIKKGDLCDNDCSHATVSEGPHVCRYRDQCLHLMASSGRYTHTDGSHKRVPFGCYKIGRVAAGDEPKFLTNDVISDHRVHDHEWARSHNLVAFAGYKLLSAEGKPIGVLALFSKQTVSPDEDALLESLANTTAQVIQSTLFEEALQEGEARYRLLAENVTDVIWVRDMNLNLTYISSSVKSQQGYTVEEAKAKTLEENWTPESLKYIGEVFAEELEIEKNKQKDMSRSRTIEVEVNCKDGSTIWTEAKMSFLRNKDGKPIGIIGVTRNINERKKVEKALRESEEKYRTVLEANPDPVVVYDIEGKVIYFNPAFTRVFGWTLEERLGNKMDIFVPEEAWRETKMMIEKVLAGERFSGIETHRYNKKGEIIPVSISGAIYKDQNGNPIGSVINLRDITKQKKLEAQLQQAHKMEAIGTLAGGIAHDFNNILSAVIGYTEIALDDIAKGTLLYDNLQEVLIAGDRAKDLVNQILTFARQSDAEVKPIKVSTIAKETLKLIRSTIPASIEIKQNIDSDSLTMTNPALVHQIFMNLYTNASHAMENEGGVLEVNLVDVKLDPALTKFHKGMKPGDYLKLSVSDTGTGISPNIIGLIFEPYFTTKEPGEGTGMGLAMVHGIIKGYDGEITVESKMGKGSVFTVYLPITKKRIDKKPYPVEEIPLGIEQILFVDDELPIVKMNKQALESLGYKVTTRTSSIDALELFRSKPNYFNLVITDMTMPNMNGDELACELMKIRPDIPVIISTGYSKKISNERAAEIGIKAFAMKPISKTELGKTVRKVLDEPKV